MPETELAVWFNLDGPPRFFRCKHGEGKSPWQVAQHNGVALLMIRTKEGSHVRHAIPLDNVLYWTISSLAIGDLTENGQDRYCNSCKSYFNSANFYLHPYPDHDVRRICCETSPQSNHDPSCTSLDQLVKSGYAPNPFFSAAYRVSDFINLKGEH